MDVDGWNVILLRRHLQFLVELRLVLDSVVSQRRVHVQGLSLSLPGVALGMHVYLLIAVQYFPDSFLSRDLKLILSVAKSIDYSDQLALLC